MNVLGSPGIGGVQNFILALATHDEKFNIRRNILFLYHDTGKMIKQYNNYNITLYNSFLILKDYNYRPYRIWKIIRNLFGGICFPFKYYISIKNSKSELVICHEPVKLLVQL